jgi:hypothetical protein
MKNGYMSCADCKEFANPIDCRKFNNFVSKMFAFVFRSDRPASITLIKKEGYDGYAKYCRDNKLMVVRKD